MRRIGALGFVTMLFLLGCAEKAAPTKPAATTTAAASAALKPKTPEQIKADRKKAEEEHEKAEEEAHKRAAHCPLYADGATAAIADVEGGVELTVTAKDDKAIKLIRADSKVLSDSTKNPPKEHHDEDPGYGPRKFGRCPVVARSTTIDFAEVPGGAKITVKAKQASDAAWVRRETRERQEDFTNKEAGPQRLAQCPSAVPGANTIITDTQGTVVVTVASRDDATIKQIRERAKYITDLVAKDAKEVKRLGDVKPGEGVGRCPLVLNDVTLTVTEIPLGAKIVMKPDDAEDAEWILDEMKERGERFVH